MAQAHASNLFIKIVLYECSYCECCSSVGKMFPIATNPRELYSKPHMRPGVYTGREHDHRNADHNERNDPDAHPNDGRP